VTAGPKIDTLAMLPVHGPSGSPAFRSGTPDTPGRPAQPAFGDALGRH
jgi:hypothetical protein